MYCTIRRNIIRRNKKSKLSTQPWCKYCLAELVMCSLEWHLGAQITKFMGPTWGPGPMLAPLTLLSGCILPSPRDLSWLLQKMFSWTHEQFTIPENLFLYVCTCTGGYVGTRACSCQHMNTGKSVFILGLSGCDHRVRCVSICFSTHRNIFFFNLSPIF